MPELTLHEVIAPTGELQRTRLVNDAGELFLAIGGEDSMRPLPPGAVEAVMRRYGKELAENLSSLHPLNVVERLDLGQGCTLVRFRFMSRYDVIARDYLAFYAPNEEPIGELAIAVTAALDHLARRFSESTC